jgi:hypothetical protein
MGPRTVTVEGTGFRCLGCNKCWWFHPLPHTNPPSDHSLMVFLWDDEINCRVPISTWMDWMADPRIPCGDEWFEITGERYRPCVATARFAPPREPCPGYVLPWPYGILGIMYGRPFDWPTRPAPSST